ncbi:amidohydrolase [Ancylomarina sp. 16SWW S1-10-2]|uniref:amidohydrolase n=1 Tax=Ancylomarina sp. 16SWW S1-10-2 TaxID=2499681 RepID=UPI0012AE1AF6|nr:amidohydrolase [Ancylomarina sp. 16SWW S1-10-2]MRT94096.1 amidohydrolase [Ancylomarina sp. 16SWW S1-10-2]
MTDILRLSLVQSELIWGDVKLNLEQFTQQLSELKGKSDLIVLPEMFTSGFTMSDKDEISRYADMTVSWMQEQAKYLGASIMGSFIVKDVDSFYNRMHTVSPNGDISTYDKRHLFRMGDEHKHFAGGKDKGIVIIGEWRIRPIVCYDLRFPVWLRNQQDYDLLVCVANWPEARRDVWNTILKARAIDNQTYVAGVNRVGKDGMNLTYAGDSSLFDAKGRVLAKCEDYKSNISTMSISLSELRKFRDKFPVYLDADDFDIKL